MEGILEIRDTCKTPIELLTSDAFENILTHIKDYSLNNFNQDKILNRKKKFCIRFILLNQ